MLPFQQNIRNLWLRLYDHIYTQKYRYLYIIHNKYRILYIYIFTVLVYMCILIFSDGMWFNLYIYISIPPLKLWSSALVAPRCPWAVSPLAGWRWPSLIPPQTRNRAYGAPVLGSPVFTPTNLSAQAILAKPFVLTGLRPPLVEGVGAGAVGKQMSKMVE